MTGSIFVSVEQQKKQKLLRQLESTGNNLLERLVKHRVGPDTHWNSNPPCDAATISNFGKNWVVSIYLIDRRDNWDDFEDGSPPDTSRGYVIEEALKENSRRIGATYLPSVWKHFKEERETDFFDRLATKAGLSGPTRWRSYRCVTWTHRGGS